MLKAWPWCRGKGMAAVRPLALIQLQNCACSRRSPRPLRSADALLSSLRRALRPRLPGLGPLTAGHRGGPWGAPCRPQADGGGHTRPCLFYSYLHSSWRLCSWPGRDMGTCHCLVLWPVLSPSDKLAGRLGDRRPGPCTAWESGPGGVVCRSNAWQPGSCARLPWGRPARICLAPGRLGMGSPGARLLHVALAALGRASWLSVAQVRASFCEGMEPDASECLL